MKQDPPSPTQAALGGQHEPGPVVFTEPGLPSPATTGIDPIFFSAPRVATAQGPRGLTNASGFFFEREGRLYLVTNRHVLLDQPTGHTPDRLTIDLHLDSVNLDRSISHTLPLYANGLATWRAAQDVGGDVDVAVLELDRQQLPPGTVVCPFTPAHLVMHAADIPVNDSLRVVGFPLGFHDMLYHLPVLRHAVLASPYGVRFQGKGFFLTDARTHRGTSGAAVVCADPHPSAQTAALPWKLLGIHSSRMDMWDRDHALDDSLGLNCVWYADVLLDLTSG